MVTTARSRWLAALAVFVALAACGPAPEATPDPITIAAADLGETTVGVAYSKTLTATGGKSPLVFKATGLPAGLTIAESGELTGTATAAGDFSVKVTVTDAAGTSASQDAALKVWPAVEIKTASLPDGTAGFAYSQKIDVQGGKAPLTVEISSGTLPAGLTFNAAETTISGTATASGAVTISIKARDAIGAVSTKDYAFQISSAIAFPATTLPDGNVGLAYPSLSLQASGGKAPLTFSVSAGQLPAGLTLSAAGALAGTPTTAGNFDFTVAVTDGNAAVATRPLHIDVFGNAPPSISTATLPNGVVGSAYSQTLAVTGGAPAYTWTVASGSLPAGLTLSSAGVITGSPTTAGPASFNVQVTDNNSQTATKTLSINVFTPVVIGTTALNEGYLTNSYSQTLTVSGGQSPYTWTATGLPTGITLTSSGILSGTPTQSGSFGVTLTVTDASGQSPTLPLTLTVYDLPTVATTSLPDGVVNAAYSENLAGQGGKQPYTFSVTGTLPAGLNHSAGVISGTPTTVGTRTFTVTVTDANGKTGTRSLSIGIYDTLTITSANPPDGYVGSAYSQIFDAQGGKAPLTWALTGGGLQAGLSFTAATATVSGTPSASGSQTFTLRVTDANGATVTKTFTLVVYNPPALTNSPRDGYLTEAYSHTLSATGGKGTLQFTLASGSPPNGITLSSGGVLSGTPTVAGSSTFSVTISDANSKTTTVSLTLTIYAQLSITTAALADGYVTGPYTQTLNALGGKSPLSWTLTTGTPPAGITLGGNQLSGTPTATGSANLTFVVTDANSRTATVTLPLVVYNPPSVGTSALADGTLNVSYSQLLQPNGGKPGFSWSLLTGAPPPGLSLAQNGTISGTPTTVGTTTFTVQVADANNVTASKQLTITVYGSLTISSSTLADGYVGAPYSQNLQAAGGRSPYQWTITTGTQVPGLTLSNGGTLSGTPTTAGTYTFTVQATDANLTSTTKQITVTIVPRPSITPTSMTDGYIGQTFFRQLTAQNGKSPYAFSSAGTLPPGVTLDQTQGTLNGSPTTAGSYTFQITVTDANTLTATQSYTVGIYDAPQITTTTPAKDAYQGSAFLQTFASTGGKSPQVWTIASGSPPTGLSLDQDGNMTGTPTATGSFAYSVRVTDANGTAATRAFTQTVLAPLALGPTSVADGYVNTAYPTTPILATGGKGPFSYQVTSGTPPAGLTVSSAGSFSGTPTTAAASVSFTVTATDANNQTVSRGYTMAVYTLPSITSDTLNDGYATVAYSTLLAATGGKSTSYSWSLAGGALPNGWTIATNGTLAGTTAATGTFNFTARVIDGNGVAATKALSVTVLPNLAVTTPSLADGYTGSAYSTPAVAATGGKSPYQFNASGLLNGLSLNQTTGAITGTPTTAGSASVVLTVTDANGTTVSKTLTLGVYAPPSITTTTLADAYLSSAYSGSVQLTGGKSPFNFTSTGTLPPGIQLSNGGALSGTPTTAGNYGFSVTVSDANGRTSTQSLSINVLVALSVVNGSLPDAYVGGAAYSAQLNAAGGRPSYTWAITTGSPPAGLSLTGNTIGGNATATGTVTFTATVTDANLVTASKSLSIAVLAMPAFGSTTLSDGYPNRPYSTQINVTGGRGPFNFTSTGTLPPGLALSGTGELSGTPTTSGTYTFSVTAKDTNNVTVTANHTVVVLQPLQITTTTLPDGYVTQTYSPTIGVSGGKSGYTFSVSSGQFPAGVSFNTSNGALSGSPTATGTSSVTVMVTDGNNVTATQALTIQVYALPNITSASPLPDAYQGGSYSFTLASTGGKAALDWTLGAPNTLPSGLSLNATSGVISGTVGATAATSTFTVVLKDANNRTVNKTFTINVLNGFNISTASLNDGYVNTALTRNLNATGGSTPYSWTATGLPAWLSLSTAGVLSGTPPSTGTFTFDVTARDSNNVVATNAPKTLTLTVLTLPTVTTTSLADAYNTRSYNQTLQPSGGKSPYTWQITTGTLPTGLTLTDTSGTIAGTPNTTTGAVSITVQVTDANGATATKALSITVYDPPAISTTSLSDGYVGTAYTQTLARTGGKANFTWAMTGTPPAGLSFNASTAVLSGTPTTATATPVSLTFTLTDANLVVATTTLTVSVYSPLQITTSSLPSAYINVPYSTSVASSGGKAPVTFTKTGTLPPGVTLASNGAFSGTPTASGTFTFSVTATDANTVAVTSNFSIVVQPPLAITTTTLKDAYRGLSYLGGGTSVSATGGRPPYTYQVSTGSPPAGITLGNDGTFSGTPTAGANTASFVVTATDQNNTTATASLTITVFDFPSITTTALSDAYIGLTYPLSGQPNTLQATGGKPALTFSISPGNLPSGLTLNTTSGAITGTPTAGATTQSFTALAQDVNLVTGTKPLSIAVYSQPVFTVTSVPDAYVNVPYSNQLTLTGGKAPITYSVTSGALPPGIVLDTTGGVATLSGSLSSSVANGTSFSFTITASDANGLQTSKAYGMGGYQLPIFSFTLPTAIEGVRFMEAPNTPVMVTVTGGKPPLTFSATNMPSGLTINGPTGRIDGTPAQGSAGTTSTTFQVNDGNGVVSGTTRSFVVIVPDPILRGGTRSIAPTGSPITDDLTVYVIDGSGNVWPGAGVRLRKNGQEFSPVKQALTGPDGKVWFGSLGLNGTTDTVDITVSHPQLTTTTYASVNAALVTVATSRYSLPLRRYSHSATWDTAAQKLLLTMGYVSTINVGSTAGNFPQSSYNDLVRLDDSQGAAWTEVLPPRLSSSPLARESAAFANAGSTTTPSALNVLFGGRTLPTGSALLDTWVYNSATNTWTGMNPPGSPSARWGAMMTSDGTGNGVLLFGGTVGGTGMNDFFRFSTQTNSWTNLPSPLGSTLQPRAYAGTAFLNGDMYVCGGTGASLFADCAAYNVASNSWRTIPGFPEGRQRFPMAAVPSLNRLYAFGGATSTITSTNDLLVYNASASPAFWSVVPQNGAVPPARQNATLTWDSVRSRLVLFGGQATGTRYGDTWTFNPATGTWTAEGPATPSVRPTFTISGTVTGALASGQTIISASGLSGFFTQVFVSTSGGSGSYTISGVPSGDTIALTAINYDDFTAPPQRLGLTPALLGPITSNTTQNLTFSSSPAPVQMTGSFGVPFSWPLASLSSTASGFQYRPGYTPFGLENARGVVGGGSTNFTVDFFTPAAPMTQDLTIDVSSTAAAACAYGRAVKLDVSAGAQGFLSIPPRATALSPGLAECSPQGQNTPVLLSQTPYQGSSFFTPVGTMTDLNLDGFADFVTVTSTIGISAFLGDGNGGVTFAGGSSSGPGGNNVAKMVLGGFNNDSYPDVVMAVPSNNSLMISFGAPGFGFAPSQFLMNAGNPTQLETADLNGDNFSDLIWNSGSTIMGALSNGTGGLSSQQSIYSVNAPNTLGALTLADLNGDGKKDIVIASNGNVLVLNGTGGLNFAFAGSYPSSGLSGSVLTVADMNADGFPDVLVGDSAGGGNVVLMQNMTGNGSLQAVGTTAMNGPIRSLGVGDFNGDGLPDLLAATNNSPAQLQLKYYFGNGTFSPTMWTTTPSNAPGALSVGDFNGDGRADFASHAMNAFEMWQWKSSIPNAVDTSFTMTNPANTQLVVFTRAQWMGQADWRYVTPAVAGAQTIVLPSASTLVTGRSAPAGQTAVWNAYHYMGTATTSVNWNHTNLGSLRVSSSAAGARVYVRQ